MQILLTFAMIAIGGVMLFVLLAKVVTAAASAAVMAIPSLIVLWFVIAILAGMIRTLFR